MNENKKRLKELALEIDDRNKDLGSPLAQALRAALDEHDMDFVETVCAAAANDVRRDIAALDAMEKVGPSCTFVATDDGKRYFKFDSEGGIDRCYQEGDLSRKEHFFENGIRQENGLAFLGAKWA